MADNIDALKSIGDSITNIGGSAADAAKGGLTLLENKMNSLMAGGFKLYQHWEGVNNAILSVNKNFGGTLQSIKKSNSYSQVFYENIVAAGASLAELGVSQEQITKLVGTLSLHTGTMVGTSAEAATNFAAISKKIGEADASSLSQELMDVGYSLNSSAEFMADMIHSSEKMGLNSMAVSNAMKANFNSLSKMTFKDGVKGITAMARESVLLGIDMGEVKRIADGLRSPEKATEFAQEMQMMGGVLAETFGDAFSVMKKARTDLPGLQKDIAKASASLYKMGEDGTFAMDQVDYDKMAILANKLSINVKTLEDSGQKLAKSQWLQKTFSLDKVKDEDLNILTGFIDFSKSNGGKIKLEGLDKLDQKTKDEYGIVDGFVDASQLTSEKINDLAKVLKGNAETEGDTNKKSIEVIKEQITASTNLTDQMKRFGDQLMAKVPDLAKMANVTTDGGKTISTEIKGIFDAINKGFNKEGIKALTDGGEELTKVFIGITNGINVGINKMVEGGANLSTILEKYNELMSETKTDGKTKEVKKKRRGGIVEFGNGGILNGPSHEEGGIPSRIKGSDKMLELEGGEAIINKKSTEMFKPLLSSLNEKGGGVKFADGGIPSNKIESMMSKMAYNGTSNVNVGSTTPINLNVNINGSIKIDGKDITIPEDEKDNLSKNIIKQVMIKVNSEIGQGTIFTAGKKKKTDYIYD